MPVESDFFMTQTQDLLPKCYNCEKILPESPPYFCDEACQTKYWGMCPTQVGKPQRTIQEIQALLKQKQVEAREKQSQANRQKLHSELSQTFKSADDPADFMAGIIDN